MYNKFYVSLEAARLLKKGMIENVFLITMTTVEK